MIMKRFCRRLLSLVLVFSLLLSSCSGDPSTPSTPVTKNNAIAMTKRNLLSVGDGFAFDVLPHIPQGFQSKYPLEQVSAWDISEVQPLFNPLGAFDAYKSGRYRYTTGTISYLNTDYCLVTQYVAGDNWQFEFAVSAYQDLLHLEQYIQDLGGELVSLAGDEIAFLIKQPNYWWWGKIVASSSYSNGLTLGVQLWREMRVEFGEPMQILPGMGDGTRLYFTTSHTTAKLQNMTVNTTARRLDISAKHYYHLGEYSKETTFKGLSDGNSFVQGTVVFDHLPQEPGDLHWTVGTGDNYLSEGDMLTLTLGETEDIPAVTMGEELGALLVKGVPWGSVEVPMNYSGLTTRHPSLQRNNAVASQTAEGDTLLWLPSGFWDVVISGHTTKLVPVSAGMLTDMTAPTNLRRDDADEATANSSDAPIEEYGLQFLGLPRETGNAVELDFVIFDSSADELLPSKDDVHIAENNLPTEVLSLTPLNLPPNVVLLLDSSGSMEGELEATLEAARSFVLGLPDDATVQIVDFDSTVQAFAGTTKEEALHSIDQITLGGSTALYGATLTGLTMLQGQERPILVVFTDGLNEPAAGGLTDKNVVLQAIIQSGAPLYCIGFGPEHAPSIPSEPVDMDSEANATLPLVEVEVKPSDLRDFAQLSGGKYYSAADQDALAKVFDAIAARIGSAFTVRYKRPSVSRLSDVPVVMLVIDNSGSMGDMLTDGSKMEILKAMYRQFLLDAPQDIMIQAMDFSFSNIQMLTSAKASMLATLSNMISSGGTDIPGATRKGFQYLMDVATSKRILVFVTDEAMIDPGNEGQHKSYASLLSEIKEAGILSLWVGLTENSLNYEDTFRHAAEFAGGSYVVSADAAALNSALVHMLETIVAPQGSGDTQISLEVLLGANSSRRSYQGTAHAALSPLPPATTFEAPPEALKIISGLPLGSLYQQSLPLGTSNGLPSEDTRLLTRTPLQAMLENSALRLQVTDMYRYSRIRGVDAPSGMMYVGLRLELSNLNNSKPLLISDITSHFFLTLNKDTYPASKCTWLVDGSLTVPGDYALSVPANGSKTGMLVFLVDEQKVTDVQLALYAAEYSSVAVRLMGEPETPIMHVQPLTKAASVAISADYTLTLTGCSDVLRIGTHAAAAGMVFRVVEGSIISSATGRFALDPKSNITMDIDTASGSFILPLSPLTSTLPLGYLNSQVLSSGLNYPFRWVFEIPDTLTNAPAGIGSNSQMMPFHLQLQAGAVFAASANRTTFDTSLGKMTINELGLLSRNEYYELIRSFDTTQEQLDAKPPTASTPSSEPNYSGGYYLIADISLDNSQGDLGISFGDTFWMIDNRLTMEESSASVLLNGERLSQYQAREMIIHSDELTSRLALGADSSMHVAVGQNRRVLLVYRLDSTDFHLANMFVPELALRATVPTTAFSNMGLLRPRMQAKPSDISFARAVDAQITRVVEQYRAAHPAAATTVLNATQSRFTLEKVGDTTEYAIPFVTSYGLEQIHAVSNEADALAMLRSMAWRPTALLEYNRKQWISQYAPEAVVTQEWGTEFDLAMLAEKLMANLGYATERREVILTEVGQQTLRDYLGIAPLPMPEGTKPPPLPLTDVQVLPAICYTDTAGANHVLVIPFMRDLDELQGYVFSKGDISSIPKRGVNSLEATIRVDILTTPLNWKAKNGGVDPYGAGAVLVDGFKGFLTDSSSTYDEQVVTLLELKLPMVDFSKDAIDISFAKNDSDEWLAFVDAPSGVQPGKRVLNSKDYVVHKVMLTLDSPSLQYSNSWDITSELPLDKWFCTMGFNTPDMSGLVANSLDAAMQEKIAEEKEEDPYSAMQRYHRSSLYSFVLGQTEAEDSIAEGMGLVLGRVTSPRYIVLSSQQNAKGVLYTSIDLASAFNDIHNTQSVAPEVVHGFNIGSGLVMCELERDCLFGDNAFGYMELWGLLPEDEEGNRPMLLIPDSGSHRRELAAQMKEEGLYPSRLIETLETTRNVVIVPRQAVEYRGEMRWAWLEIDPVSYRTISVFDNGAHSAMLEYALLFEAKEFASGTVAGFYCGFVTTGAFFAAEVIRNFDVQGAKDYAKAAGALMSAGVGAAGALATGSWQSAATTLFGTFLDGATAMAFSVFNGLVLSGGGLSDGFSMGFDLGVGAYRGMIEAVSP